ncbi:MAG: MIP family channel protein [Alistipes sp.]
MMKKYFAELIGTMVLVLMGCGSAIFAGDAANAVASGVGTLGVAFAFGLSVVAMAYAIGGISGCHINPAITLGVWLSNRMSGKDAAMYMLFQFVGAAIGSAILYLLVSSGAHNGPTATGSNGFADGQMLQAFVAEAIFTFIFVLVVLGSTDKERGAGNLAGLAIGLTLVLVHIVCIPITGTSVNPARSFGPALFQGGAALSQLWLFIVAPFVGAILSAIVWKALTSPCACEKKEKKAKR